ncbi:MAG: ribosome small subunit-dependent GTPase A, partial [candidate division Zixibacteria bacterium]
GSMEPIVAINKADLAHPQRLEDVIRVYRQVGCTVLLVSAETGEGLEELRAELIGHRTLLAGHSGVGKSSLLNSLIPGLEIHTREISTFSDKGKHTTTSVRLYELPSGGFVVDSPGLKLMRLWKVTPEELSHYYPEFETLAIDCRFRSCRHTHEPDCAVKSAVSAGKVSQLRYDNYVGILESLS